MKIGDKVRFLSEVGGGHIKGFQGKDIVLVEDEDGFDIPMLRSEVVVIDTDDFNIAKVNTLKPQNLPSKSLIEEEETEPADKPTTYKATPVERKDGNRISLYLSFLPTEIKSLSGTSFETYLVNDSNYYLQVLYMSTEGESRHARFCSTIEPNSKVFVEEINHAMLNELERLCFQVMAWKQDKPFELKQPQTVEIRLDGTKFYKLHTFTPNLFFKEPNLTFPIIEQDKAKRSVFVDAEQLADSLMKSKKEDNEKKQTPKKEKRETTKKEDVLEVDLHAEELISTTSGMSNGDILMMQMKEFQRIMDENIKHTGKCIVFIHGKGEGVLRKNILQELKYRYKGCTWQDASFREYGFGATMVKIGQSK